MAKDIDQASGEPQQTSPKSDIPYVESPSISPATPEAVAEPAIEPSPAIEAMVAAAIAPAAPAAPSRFVIRPRNKRHALLAASVALAAALGAVIGAAASGGFGTPAPQADVASVEERKAMQKSIGQLAKEVTTLKTSLEAANKSAHAQLAKITERIDRSASAELVTGSISPPQTVAAVVTPMPTPRPAPRIAAVETQPPARPQVVQGWAIRETRDGFVYVEGHGDIYQVVPGASLPGLGPVGSIKRQDGRWVVTTPKGLIVSMRDRRYFE